MATSESPPTTCPDCQTLLPTERASSPWCICGWSSAPDEAEAWIFTKQDRVRIANDRNRAKRLAEHDAWARRMAQHPAGQLLWRAYLLLLLLLSLPVLLVQGGLWLIFWGGLSGLFITALVMQWRTAAWLSGIVLGAALAVAGLTWLTRPKPLPKLGLDLTPALAPELFAALTTVANKLGVEVTTWRVQLQLAPNASIQQRWVWRGGPRWVTQLNIGLLMCYGLTVEQLQAVLAHEAAHLKHRHTLWIQVFGRALQTVQDWGTLCHDFSHKTSTPSIYAFFLQVLAWIGFGLARLYYHLLLWVGLWAMRRQEYDADAAAARLYGSTAACQALIEIAALQLKFHEYFPQMVQQQGGDMVQTHDLQRLNFYQQFIQHWQYLSAPLRQRLYARALASYRSLYDTHPSYQDRYRAFNEIALVSPAPTGGQPALELLPNAVEYGQKLTQQIWQRHWARSA